MIGLALLALALLAQAAWALVAAAGQPARRAVILVAMVGVAACVVAAPLIAPHVPVSGLTLLHEGGTERVVRSLHGHNAHAGPIWQALGALGARSSEPLGGIRALMAANLAATTATGVLLASMASGLQRSRLLAAVLTAAWLLHPSVRNAAWSELAAPLATFAVVAALATASLAQGRGARERVAAAAVCGLWGAVAFGTRTETALLPLVLGAAIAPRPAAVERIGARAWPRLQSWLGPELRRSRRAAWLAAGLLLVGFPAGMIGRLGADLELRTLALGLAGAWPSPLNLAAFLAQTTDWLLLGLAAAGVVRAVRRPGLTRWLLVAVVVLSRVLLKAGHGVFFEQQRYAVPLVALLVPAAAWGAALLARRLEAAGWLPAWRPALVAGAVALVFARNVPGQRLLQRPLGEGDAGPEALLLDWDVQREGRFVARALAEAPAGCLLLAPISQDREDRLGRGQLRLMGFGPAVGRPVWAERGVTEPLVAARALAPEARCVRLIAGLDCHLDGVSACAAMATAAPLSQVRFARVPYNDAEEYGATRGEITLSVHALAP